MLDTETLYDEAEVTSVLKNDDPKEESYTIKKPSTVTLHGVTSAEDDYEDKAIDERVRNKAEESKTRERALLLGTMVHRLMEVLVSSGNKVDLNELVIETVKEYQADDEYYRNSLLSIGKTIRAGGYTQQNGAPQDILNELLTADEVFCEVPFCYNEGKGKIWHGVIDVVYRKDNKWHIVDYKTNADADDLDSYYQEQLETYRKAFREITGNDSDAIIYHIQKEA